MTNPATRVLRSFRAGLAALAAVLLLSTVASAQTTLTNTTLSAAITNPNDQSMSITSATGWTASSSQSQTYALINREVVGIRSITGTTIGITRGLFSTRATGHLTGQKIWFIPAGSLAITNSDRAGACSTAGSSDLSQSGAVVPVFNVTSGNTFYCLGSNWVPTTYLMDVDFCSVTQATSKSTGVTCSGQGGTITMNAAGLATVTTANFTVTDAQVAAADTVMVAIKSGATAASYQATVDAVAAGSFVVSLRNYSGGTLSEAVVLNFAVLKVN